MTDKPSNRIKTLLFGEPVAETAVVRAQLAAAGFAAVVEAHLLEDAQVALHQGARGDVAVSAVQAVIVDWRGAASAAFVAWLGDEARRTSRAPRQTPLPLLVLVDDADLGAAQAAAAGLGAIFLRRPLAPLALRQALAGVEALCRDPLPGRRPVVRPVERLRLLVVEDQKNIRHLIAAIYLHDLGYRDVATAPDGRDAWAVIEAAAASDQPFDVVISDWTMPHVDGLELFQRLRALPATAATPFILLTAHSMQEDVLRAIETGVRHYITKPFSLETLEAKLKEATATLAAS